MLPSPPENKNNCNFLQCLQATCCILRYNYMHILKTYKRILSLKCLLKETTLYNWLKKEAHGIKDFFLFLLLFPSPEQYFCI